MNVLVSSKNVEVPESLVRSAEEKINHLGKLIGGVERAELRFTEEKNPRISQKDLCNLKVVGKNKVVRARACAHDPAAALEVVVNKAIHRLEKPKAH